MNTEELKKRLEKEGVCPRVYSLFSDGMSECYVLTKEGHEWHVYYAERGERVDLQSFKNEDDACRCFLEIVLSDPSARRKIFTPADFERSAIWTGNDKKGYRPVSEIGPFPEDYNDELYIKSTFRTGKYVFGGYLVFAKVICVCGLFVNGELIKINVRHSVFTDDNLKEVYRLLGSSPFKFFPLHYQSEVNLKGVGAIHGVLSY
jgi:hypothetical protein